MKKLPDDYDVKTHPRWVSDEEITEYIMTAPLFGCAIGAAQEMRRRIFDDSGTQRLLPEQREELQYIFMMHLHKEPHIWKFDKLIEKIERVIFRTEMTEL